MACSSDGLCVKINDTTHCDTNQQCIDRNSGQPAFCRKSDHLCIPLASADCTQVLADATDLTNDNVIFLGMITPKSGPQAAQAVPLINAVELARRDFTLSGRGIPSVSGTPNPLAVVVCDEAVDYMRAAKHLVEDVGVPAIIGPSFSQFQATLATSYSAQKNVLLMGTTGGAALITTLNVAPFGERMVWRTVPSDNEHAIVNAKLVPGVEKQLQDAGVIPAGTPTRVAVIHRGDNFGVGLANTVFDNIMFNGKNATDNGNAGNYLDIDYGDPQDTVNNPNPQSKYSAAVVQLTQFQPHIIIAGGADELNANITGPAEGAWTASYRPRWLYVTAAALSSALIGTVNAQPAGSTLRSRVTVSVAGRLGPLDAKFNQYYTSVFTDGSKPSLYAAGSYDAFYLLAYGMTAELGQPLNGTTIAKGMKHLLPPAPVTATGADAISSTLLTLSHGGSIDYDGAVGALDFDPAVGEAPNDIQLFCLTADATSGQTNGFAPSGVFYDAAKQSLTGTPACK